MSAIPSIKAIFGQGAEEFATLASRIEVELGKREVKYSFCPLKDFERLITQEEARAQYIYWSEIVGRAHFSAVSSILRSAQWLRGVQLSCEQDLYLPFCANLRSLIESAADSLTGVSGVAQTFSENRVAINNALKMQSEQIMISRELEDQLIHFSHGRKLEKYQVAPQSHSAKSARHYVDQLENLGLDQAHEMYSQLCQVTHPAAESVCHFLSRIGESEFMVFAHNDRAAITELIERNREFLHALLRYVFNQPIILLRVLLHFDLHEYHSGEISQLDLSAMPGWQRCAKLMGVAP